MGITQGALMPLVMVTLAIPLDEMSKHCPVDSE